MIASIIPLHMNLAVYIGIYLPLTLMIYPALIKEPSFTQICYQLPYLLPLYNYFSTFTNPSDFPDLLPSDDHNNIRVMRGKVFLVRAKRGYCFRENEKKII